MPKSSVHRLLGAMVRKGIVERDERSRYRPGTGLLVLWPGILDREPVVVCGRAVLPDFVERTGETTFLVGQRGWKLVVLDKCEGRGLLRARRPGAQCARQGCRSLRRQCVRPDRRRSCHASDH